MPAGIVRTEVIVHGSDGMFHCDILVFIITADFACRKQQVEVHHVVNDYREIPGSEIPGTDTTDIAVETLAEVVGCFYDHSIDGIIRRQAFCITIAAVDHEAQVVCTGIIADRIQQVGEFSSRSLQRILSGQFISIPQRARIETAGPVVHA